MLHALVLAACYSDRKKDRRIVRCLGEMNRYLILIQQHIDQARNFYEAVFESLPNSSLLDPPEAFSCCFFEVLQCRVKQLSSLWPQKPSALVLVPRCIMMELCMELSFVGALGSSSLLELRRSHAVLLRSKHSMLCSITSFRLGQSPLFLLHSLNQ